MNERFERLDLIADQMKALRFSSSSTMSYDMMADAIWWSDELPNFKKAEDHWCLRPVFRYRTTLILGAPEAKRLPFWERSALIHPFRREPDAVQLISRRSGIVRYVQGGVAKLSHGRH